MTPTQGTVAAGLLVLAACGVGAAPGPRSRLAVLARRSWWTPALLKGQATARAIMKRAETSPSVSAACVAGCGGSVAAAPHGPVAGVLVAAYAGLLAHVLLRRRAARNARRALIGALDGIAAVVGDLRAGAPPGDALGAAMPQLIGATSGARGAASVADLAGRLDATPRGRVISKLVAAWRLADTIGAPLADVLERLDTEVRSGERAKAMAAAHAASARATAALLAVLPLVGVVLGYAMGADPVAVLLHTPIGAACAIGAVVLQLTGLAWAARLAHVDPDRVEPAGER